MSAADNTNKAGERDGRSQSPDASPGTPHEPSARSADGAYHHGNLQQALVVRGVEILEKEGMAALSLRRAAREVGVSQTAPLHHFKGKTGYLAAIAAHGFQMLLSERASAVDKRLTPREQLLNMMQAHLRFAVEHSGLFHVMFGPEIQNKAQFPALEHAAQSAYAVLETCVSDYLSSRNAPAARVLPAVLAAWAACHGLSTAMLERPISSQILRRDPMELGLEVLAIFVAGLDGL